MSGKNRGVQKSGQQPKPPQQLIQAKAEVTRTSRGDVTHSAVYQQYTGPVPPPQFLAEYEAIHPGLANRLITMAEQNAAHRRSIEAAVVNGNVDAQRRGSIFALVITMALVLFAGYLAWLGMPGYAVIAVLPEIAIVGGLFVYSRSQQRRERKAKVEKESDIPKVQGPSEDAKPETAPPLHDG